MVIVHGVGVQAPQQTGEMIQAMAIVAADAGIENEWNTPRVSFNRQGSQQILALREDGHCGVENSRSVLRSRFKGRLGCVSERDRKPT